MLRISCLFAVALLATGCGEDQSLKIEETVPVSGVLHYDGKPLEGYRVRFTPSSDARSASGRTGPDGKFTLGTNTEGDGAVVGSHKVSIVYDPAVTPPEPGPGQPADAEIPPPSVKLPEKYNDAEKSGITVEVPEAGLTDYKLELE